MSTGIAIPGTLLHRVILACLPHIVHSRNGLIYSLKVVLLSENFT